MSPRCRARPRPAAAASKTRRHAPPTRAQGRPSGRPFLWSLDCLRPHCGRCDPHPTPAGSRPSSPTVGFPKGTRARAIIGAMQTSHSPRGIRLVGFDADDTLWRSQDYYHAAQAEFERIVGALRRPARRRRAGAPVRRREAQPRAVRLRRQRHGAVDDRGRGGDHRAAHQRRRPAPHRRAGQGTAAPSGRTAAGHRARQSTRSLREHEVVLITKGDLFHQEDKVAQCGLAPTVPAHRDRQREGHVDLRARCCGSSRWGGRSSSWSAIRCVRTSRRCWRWAGGACTCRTTSTWAHENEARRRRRRAAPAPRVDRRPNCRRP